MSDTPAADPSASLAEALKQSVADQVTDTLNHIATVVGRAIHSPDALAARAATSTLAPFQFPDSVESWEQAVQMSLYRLRSLRLNRDDIQSSLRTANTAALHVRRLVIAEAVKAAKSPTRAEEEARRDDRTLTQETLIAACQTLLDYAETAYKTALRDHEALMASRFANHSTRS